MYNTFSKGGGTVDQEQYEQWQQQQQEEEEEARACFLAGQQQQQRDSRLHRQRNVGVNQASDINSDVSNYYGMSGPTDVRRRASRGFTSSQGRTSQDYNQTTSGQRTSYVPQTDYLG